MDDCGDIAQLLRDASAGDKSAMDRLFPIVYPDLRRLAEACLRHERPAHTLQRTALVHEAYLRLRGQNLPAVEDRTHFLKLAIRVMRQVLVDHARRRNMSKRSAPQVPLDEAWGTTLDRPEWMVELNDAISELEKRDGRKARLIEMRYFVGFSAEESAEFLEMDVRDVRRELRLAQAWLGRELSRRVTEKG